MFFELQLSANVFTKIIRNRIKALPICKDQTIKDQDGNLLVLDQVVIGESTWIQREKKIVIVNNLPQSTDVATHIVWIFSPTNLTSFTVPYMQVKQEIIVHLVKPADLEANGPNPTPAFKTLNLYAVFNVALDAPNQTSGGGPVSISYTLAEIDFGILAVGMTNTQLDEMRQFLNGIKLPMTTVDLSPLTAMLKRQVKAINVGITCDPAGTFVAMRIDFDVYISPPAVDKAFFEAGPENMLDGKDWAMIIDANALTNDAKDKAKNALQKAPKVKLNAGPNVSWDPSGPAINIASEIELMDACPFFVDNIDMDADVDIRVSFSIPVANTLRTHFYLGAEPSDVGEEIACALTGALFWPFIGPIMLKDEDIGAGIGAYLGGLAGGPAVMFFGIIAAIESAGLTKDISQSLGSTCAKQDDENYQCNDVLNLSMQLTPPNYSKLEVERIAGVPRGLVVGGTVSNLRDFRMGSLEPIDVKPFTWQIIGRCKGNGQNNFDIGNKATITVYCLPPAQICKVELINDELKEFDMKIDQGVITISPRWTYPYSVSPYPLKIKIITNRGVRIITLAPPKAITSGEQELLDTAKLRAIASCYFWEKMFTPVEKIRWLPDPPFDDRMYIRYWQIVVRNLQEEDSLRVEGMDGSTIMTANPSRAGVAHMTMMFRNDNAPDELSLELIGRREERDELREISVQQVLFAHQSTIPFRGRILGMNFYGNSRSHQLSVMTEDGDYAWDVLSSSAPVLLHALSKSRDDNQEHLPLHSGKRIGGKLSENMRRQLARIEDRQGRAEVIGSPRIGGLKESFYVRNKEKIILYDISHPEELREMQVFSSKAWFDGTAMSGKLLAVYNEEQGQIEIYSAMKSKLM